MVFARLLNSRSVRIVQKTAQLSAKPCHISKRFLQEIPRRHVTHDISLTEGLTWITFGGVPIALFGLYITKTLRDTIEAAEAGLLAPGTGPESRLTNDQWLALKEEVRRMAAEEDEDEAEASSDSFVAAEEESPAAAASSESEEFIVVETPCDDPPTSLEKDTVIFIDPPAKE